MSTTGQARGISRLPPPASRLPPPCHHLQHSESGKKLRDITTGTISIVGRTISTKHKGTARYVVRGWLELPNMTILKVAGPWYEGHEIPERMFTAFSADSRFILTTKWVRKN
ncbi:MAG TPA: hypothetical protein VN643_10535 [Pyrinomonadaceae bacterium]|nr:hypothetical protein [Pyrinomonadaceae bacterium]